MLRRLGYDDLADELEDLLEAAKPVRAHAWVDSVDGDGIPVTVCSKLPFARVWPWCSLLTGMPG